MVIGLPTLRLRGDYIAIVTLAFGEIVGTIAVNGDAIDMPFTHNATLTNGQQAISPLDPLSLPILGEFNQATNIRPFYWVALALVVFTLFVNFRLRDSRLGRAWIALREDEVAAPAWACRSCAPSCWRTRPAPRWAAWPAPSSATTSTA